MTSTRAYSELLKTLYGSPLDEVQWGRFLAQLCEFTGSTMAMFLRNDRASGDRLLASAGAGADAEGYNAVFREAFLRSPRVGVIEGDDLVPREVWVRSEAYQGAATRFGLEHVTCMVLSVSATAYDLISLWRGPERRQMEQESTELLTMLIPHVQNALAMRTALGAAESRARGAEAMLNASATASILLDGDGAIVQMNDEARRLAAGCDGICMRGKKLVAAARSQQAELGALIGACAAADLGHPGGALALARGGARRPLQVLIAPVRVSGGEGSDVRVLVLATDPERAAEFPEALLRQVYGLTPAETEIANALMAGSSLDEIARMRTVSVATVRSQMKTLLGKTDTQRQGELIGLLATLPRAAAGRVQLC